VKPDHALRALYYTGEHREIPAINYTLLHGVRAALALSRTSAAEPRKLHNPAVSPHLKFVDLGGHGYGLVTVTADWLEAEFVIRCQMTTGRMANGEWRNRQPSA
jgi:alkaline phosphatase D